LESKIVGSEGKVIAIEPSPLNFQQLQKNIKNENTTNVELHQVAGGDYNGTIKFYLNPHSNLSRIITDDSDLPKEGQIIEVPIITLDSFLEKNQIKKLDFIRMDVEGYEYNILQGMKNSIKKFKPMIQLEVHTSLLGEKKTKDLLEWLKIENYQIVYNIVRQLDCPTVGELSDVKQQSIQELLNKKKLPDAILMFLK
jgi:FkbM family methyltransferase